MAYFENLPFQRGDTFEITNSTDGAYLLGQEYIVEDKDPTNPQRKRSNRLVHLRAVRNSSGIAFLPKRLVQYKTGTNHTEVDGYVRTDAAWYAGVVDEFLPADGVANNDVFFITVKGPSLCLTKETALSSIAADAIVVAATGANSTGGATAGGPGGRVDVAVFTGATAVLADQINNKVGRAMSAVTTNNTNADILIDIRCDY